MFKYVSPETGKEKTIDLNAQACIQARFVEKMSWNNIANTGEHQDKLGREVRFGSACNTRNLNDVRQSDEWEKEVHRFADEGGHDAQSVLHVAIPRQRANPVPAPKLKDVDTEPLAEATSSAVMYVTIDRDVFAEALALGAEHAIEYVQDELAKGLYHTPFAGNLHANDAQPAPTTLEAVSSPSKWVIDTHGDSVNLDHASAVNVGEESVYARIGDEVRHLYRGEHLREYYTWITTKVLNVSDFEWDVDEDDDTTSNNIIADDDTATHHHWIIDDENPEDEADEDEEYHEDEDAG